MVLTKKKQMSSDGEGSAMEVDKPTSQSWPSVPPPIPCKPEVLNQPALVDGDSMKEWSHKLVIRHQLWEVGESITKQLNVTVDTMTQV